MRILFLSFSFLILCLRTACADQDPETLLLISPKDVATNSVTITSTSGFTDVERAFGCKAWISFSFADMPHETVRRIARVHQLRRVRIKGRDGQLSEDGWV